MLNLFTGTYQHKRKHTNSVQKRQISSQELISIEGNTPILYKTQNWLIYKWQFLMSTRFETTLWTHKTNQSCCCLLAIIDFDLFTDSNICHEGWVFAVHALWKTKSNLFQEDVEVVEKFSKGWLIPH